MVSTMPRFMALIIIVVRLFVKTSAYCNGRSCPNGFTYNYPFYCEEFKYSFNVTIGYPELPINCADDGRPVMNISNRIYYVQSIDYGYQRLRVVDGDIDGQDCPQPKRNISLQSTLSLYYDEKIIIFYNCSSHPEDVEDNIPCLNNYSNNSNSTLRSFAFNESQVPSFNWYENCEKSVLVPLSFYSNYTTASKLGFDIRWSNPNPDCEDCERSGGQCTENGCYCKDNDSWVHQGICQQNPTSPEENKNRTASQGIPTGLKIILGVAAGVGGLLLILLLVYRRILYSLYYFIISVRDKIRSPTNMEIFLESCGNLTIQRYRYSDIKKMTNLFKETLGQGGFGSVFKGKLCDGRLVAVKVLNETKGNGEDFINEVATIGRTNHVNVVSLLGFCIDGTRRALVYEFMPNSSLEKFIYNEKNSGTTSLPLGWENLYQIALGIARGLEYLHRGCNTRILHFDIKPHNILLDRDFCPKISDFGLAKLCPTRDSVVSMVGARGTIGYIAPEVYCRNFGGVSHKSDVYSYGMMVLEMIGGRKNIDATGENTSEIYERYFPHWIYNHLKGEIKIEGPENVKIKGFGDTFDDEVAKKMIIVALWCIQTHPAKRPSISNVVDMLEGNIEELQMPSNPFEEPYSTFSSSS